MSESSESAAESTSLAWDHLYSSSSPGLRRWLTTGQPVALHHDMLMVAVPNIFTRNQLENRFRSDIERLLSGYFGRNIQLAVIVDESLKPDPESLAEEPTYDGGLGQAPRHSSQTQAPTPVISLARTTATDDYAAPDFQAEAAFPAPRSTPRDAPS